MSPGASFGILLSFCTAAAAVAQAPAAPPPSLNSLVDALSCVEFEWVKAEGLSDRAGMRVPLEIGGSRYMFQLDTGANVSFIYGTQAKERGWAKEGDRVVALSTIKLAGHLLPPTPLFIRADLDREGGTIGLDMLMNHYVVIDYPRRRFCMVPRAEMTAALHRRVKWAPAEIRGGKLYVSMKLGSEPLNDVFFDTGASSTFLNLDHANWAKATGLPDPKHAPRQFQVSSWGKMVTMASAPGRSTLDIAGVSLPVSSVETWRDDPDFYRRFPSVTGGLLGNAPLWDRVIILNMTVNTEMGILQ